ncbi:MAG: hypothetical protein DWQ47_11485 [Acidobacteria bacterium]|nr:MAG: hypothetical protein DWQ32_13900 [Acidobacteriota bacterium]REJ98197.1 MAG: hypothetical protein DWQ38_16700 [Acidobacteriota bacterium]REK16941.1 MAG: hypothetical protein DWQ43_01745 [Acidobacteriota bacterium]REK42851.1 MAG: hypothetical protein DWQ47_11485 [Acidobacteriota bacterium]
MPYLFSILFSVAALLNCSVNSFVEEEVAADAKENSPARVEVVQDERFDQTYPLNLNGDVKAANVNGSIKVTTWDSPQVRLVAVKSASNPEHLKYVDIKVESDESSFYVKADYRDRKEMADEGWRRADDLKVEFELTVPRTSNLVGISTVNGNVSIDGSDGNTKASTVNGTVRASNLGGSAKLTTVNGTVEADFEQLYQASDIKMTTVNGQVILTLPSDANATIKANSLSGSIDNEFGLPVRKGEFVGRDMHGMLGSGDVKIKMSSVSGGLTVKRANDGRTPNPTTNLLKMKDSSETY